MGIATESNDANYDKEVKSKRNRKSEVVFSRPVFAQEFFTEEAKKQFDDLPQWQRHLIKRLVDHGDLKRASREAGVSRFVDENVDVKLGEVKTIKQALIDGGITTQKIVDALADCLEANSVRFDSHQNPIQFTDLKLKLQTVSVICQLRGDFIQKPDDEKDKTKGIVELFEDTNIERKNEKST